LFLADVKDSDSHVFFAVLVLCEMVIELDVGKVPELDMSLMFVEALA
jgi:hypothetical protein